MDEAIALTGARRPTRSSRRRLDDVAYLGWEVADEHACHALAELTHSTEEKAAPPQAV